MSEAKRSELAEIAGQLGILGVSAATGRHELRVMINEAGVTDAEIDAEVEEQRGRRTRGRPT